MSNSANKLTHIFSEPKRVNKIPCYNSSRTINDSIDKIKTSTLSTSPTYRDIAILRKSLRALDPNNTVGKIWP